MMEGPPWAHPEKGGWSRGWMGHAGEPASCTSLRTWWLFHHSCWCWERLYLTPASSSVFVPCQCLARAALPEREAFCILLGKKGGWVLKP